MLNRRERFEYHIPETFETGIMLTGLGAKSLLAGQALQIPSGAFGFS